MKNSCKILAMPNGDLFTQKGELLSLWVEIKDESTGAATAKTRADGSMYFAKAGSALRANLNYANNLIDLIGGVDALTEGFDINGFLESVGLPTFGAAIVETTEPQYEGQKPYARYSESARLQIAALQAGNLAAPKKAEAIAKLKKQLAAKNALLEDILAEDGSPIYRKVIAVDATQASALTKRVKQMAREAVKEGK